MKYEFKDILPCFALSEVFAVCLGYKAIIKDYRSSGQLQCVDENKKQMESFQSCGENKLQWRKKSNPLITAFAGNELD